MYVLISLLACSTETVPTEPPLTPPMEMQAICVDVVPAVDGATIRVDGVVVSERCTSDSYMYRGPDIREVEVSAPGHRPWKRSVKPEIGETHVEVTLEKL